MSGIYLASFQALHKDYDILYQDINGKRDLGGDMMDYNLNDYDFVIATPPCNYYSIMNYRRNVSKYALATKHLLPDILKKLLNCNKPWLVENVRNKPMFVEAGLYNLPCFIYEIGRHTYWSNIMFNPYVEQRQDFLNGGIVIRYEDMDTLHHQGGFNVHNVVESFLDSCKQLNLI